MFAKTILDYNAATLKANKDGKKQAMTINLAGLAMGNAWTDPYFDNTATVSQGLIVFLAAFGCSRGMCCTPQLPRQASNAQT